MQLLMIATECVTVMGGAARNSGVPAAARGQALLGVLPVVFACAWVREPAYLVLAVLMLVGLVTALEISRGLHARTVEAFTLAEEKAGLVASLQDASARLEAANRQLEIAALSDALTGIANRRRFDAAITVEISRALRSSATFSLLLFDIDKFKAYNDRFGHPAGDACLRSVAQALARAIRRPGDIVARYGGEEFVALLPHAEIDGGQRVAERARVAVRALGLANPDGPAGIVTVSIGVATFAPERHPGAADVIAEADRCLYAAKAAGRDCVRAGLPGDSPATVLA
jgi:diguanylate cyclase (GGDEF)-like protein